MRYRKSTIWKEAPFVRLILPFCAGIVIEKYLQFTLHTWLPAILVCCLPFFLFPLLPLYIRFAGRWVYGFMLNGVLLIAGGVLAFYHDSNLSASGLARQYKSGDIALIKITEAVSETPATFKSIATVSHLLKGDTLIGVHGKLIAYFRKDATAAGLQYGSEMILFSALQPVMNSGNPGSFDFAAYASLQGITMQAFVASGDYRLTPSKKSLDIKAWLLASRAQICAILKKYIPGSVEKGLAEALLVGYKEDLDKDLLQVYSNTGVVHVIAISGLHLGILYIIGKGLLSFLPAFRYRKMVISILIIVFLWIFSLLTGGSPSVLRSAVMFTAILAGESFERKISIYNCLAASAFILLSYRPYWIFDIGFQLSYAAVLGILVFHKPVYQLLFVNNKLLDMIWQMTAVTLSAQVLTTPVSLFYFHQFPVYFLPANLIAVPLSSAALIITIFLCMVSIVPVVPEITGKILSWLIRFMNHSIGNIDHLPFSVASGIEITLLQASVLYGVIFTVSVFLFYRQKMALYAAILFILILSSANLNYRLNVSQRELLIVYNIKGKQVIEIIAGRQSVRTGAHASCVENDCRNTIREAHTRLGVINTATINVPEKITGKKKSVSFLKGPPQMHPGVTAPTMVVLSPTSVNADSILSVLRPANVVLDASHTSASVKMWTNACNKHHINIHPVAWKGAFVMTLN